MSGFTFFPLPLTESTNARNAWRITGGMADMCLFAAHHKWLKFALSARFIQRRWGIGQNAAERVIDELIRRWDITITQCLYVGRWTRHLLFARPSKNAVPVPNELLHAIPLGHCSVCVSEQQRQCDDCQPGKVWRLKMLAAVASIYGEAYRNPKVEGNRSRIPVVSFDEPVRAAGAAVVELMREEHHNERVVGADPVDIQARRQLIRDSYPLPSLARDPAEHKRAWEQEQEQQRERDREVAEMRADVDSSELWQERQQQEQEHERAQEQERERAQEQEREREIARHEQSRGWDDWMPDL